MRTDGVKPLGRDRVLGLPSLISGRFLVTALVCGILMEYYYIGFVW